MRIPLLELWPWNVANLPAITAVNFLSRSSGPSKCFSDRKKISPPSHQSLFASWKKKLPSVRFSLSSAKPLGAERSWNSTHLPTFLLLERRVITETSQESFTGDIYSQSWVITIIFSSSFKSRGTEVEAKERDYLYGDENRRFFACQYFIRWKRRALVILFLLFWNSFNFLVYFRVSRSQNIQNNEE